MPSLRRPIVKVQDLRFSRGETLVLDHIDFEIREGEYVGIIGPNGGGKTTLLELLLGLLPVQEGSVTWFGKSAIAASRAQVGFVPQHAASFHHAFPATVAEIVMSGRTALRGPLRRLTTHDKARVQKALRVCGIEHLAQRRIGNVSGGERQRAFLARALAGEPRVLVLDEPMAAVDEIQQKTLYDVLRQLHRSSHMTIIMVSHDISAVEREASRIFCLNRHLVPHEQGRDHGWYH